MCTHWTHCPDAESAGRTLAVVVAAHHEQGWALLCNGVIHFDDDIDLLPNDSHRASGPARRVTAPPGR